MTNGRYRWVMDFGVVPMINGAVITTNLTRPFGENACVSDLGLPENAVLEWRKVLAKNKGLAITAGRPVLATLQADVETPEGPVGRLKVLGATDEQIQENVRGILRQRLVHADSPEVAASGRVVSKHAQVVAFATCQVAPF